MINFIIQAEDEGIFFNQPISTGFLIFSLFFASAIYVAFYLLRSFGLYKIAKNRGIDKAYLAFIPAVWMYTACKIIGNTRVFGVSADKSAVWVTVVFSCAVALPLIINGFNYIPYVIRVLQGQNIDITVINGDVVINPQLVYSNGLAIVLTILNVLSSLLSIAQIFLLITVYIALFKMYWTEHYILGAVLSFLGLFPIIVFAVRNRKAVDFNEYFRQRYYGSRYTPYGNGFNGGQGGQNRTYYGNPNVGNYYNNQPNNGGNSEPFDEFSGRPEEPFGEFSDDKKNNNQSDNKDDFFS